MICVAMWLLAMLMCIAGSVIDHIKLRVKHSVQPVLERIDLLCAVVGVTSAVVSFCLYVTGNGPK